MTRPHATHRARILLIVALLVGGPIAWLTYHHVQFPAYVANTVVRKSETCAEAYATPKFSCCYKTPCMIAMPDRLILRRLMAARNSAIFDVSSRYNRRCELQGFAVSNGGDDFHLVWTDEAGNEICCAWILAGSVVVSDLTSTDKAVVEWRFPYCLYYELKYDLLREARSPPFYQLWPDEFECPEAAAAAPVGNGSR